MTKPPVCRDLFNARDQKDAIHKWLAENTQRIMEDEKKKMKIWNMSPQLLCSSFQPSCLCAGSVLVEVSKARPLFYQKYKREDGSYDYSRSDRDTVENDDEDIEIIYKKHLSNPTMNLLAKPVVRPVVAKRNLIECTVRKRSLTADGLGKRKTSAIVLDHIQPASPKALKLNKKEI